MTSYALFRSGAETGCDLPSRILVAKAQFVGILTLSYY